MIDIVRSDGSIQFARMLASVGCHFDVFSIEKKKKSNVDHTLLYVSIMMQQWLSRGVRVYHAIVILYIKNIDEKSMRITTRERLSLQQSVLLRSQFINGTELCA